MTNQKDWEEEFDKNIESLPVYIKDIDKWFENNPDTLYNTFAYPETILELDPEKLKAFIRQTLLSQRQELQEMIKSLENQINLIKDIVGHPLPYEQIVMRIKLALSGKWEKADISKAISEYLRGKERQELIKELVEEVGKMKNNEKCSKGWGCDNCGGCVDLHDQALEQVIKLLNERDNPIK